MWSAVRCGIGLLDWEGRAAKAATARAVLPKSVWQRTADARTRAGAWAVALDIQHLCLIGIEQASRPTHRKKQLYGTASRSTLSI